MTKFDVYFCSYCSPWFLRNKRQVFKWQVTSHLSSQFERIKTESYQNNNKATKFFSVKSEPPPSFPTCPTSSPFGLTDFLNLAGDSVRVQAAHVKNSFTTWTQKIHTLKIVMERNFTFLAWRFQVSEDWIRYLWISYCFLDKSIFKLLTEIRKKSRQMTWNIFEKIWHFNFTRFPCLLLTRICFDQQSTKKTS